MLIKTATFIVLGLAWDHIAAQPQVYDFFTFSIPSGYTVKRGKTFLDFLKYNEKRTAYAQITFYHSRAASSDLRAEFAKEWKRLVKGSQAIPHAADSETESGWLATFGSARVDTSLGKYIQTLILFAGNNLVTSISVRATDDLFSKEVEDILQSVVLRAPATRK